MIKLEKWVAKNYPDGKRREFANEKKKGHLLFTGIFYDQFKTDKFGVVGGHICPDCQSNRGHEGEQWDELSEVAELPKNQSFERPCLCEEGEVKEQNKCGKCGQTTTYKPLVFERKNWPKPSPLPKSNSMNKLDQKVAKLLLLLADNKIRKINVAIDAHNGRGKRKEIWYAEFYANFFQNIIGFVETNGRLTSGSPVNIGKNPHENWFFGRYGIYLIGSNGEPMPHSFGLSIEPSGLFETGCQTCPLDGCSGFDEN